MEQNLGQAKHTAGRDANELEPLWKTPHRRLAYALTADGHQLLCYRTQGSVFWTWAFRALGTGNPGRAVTAEGREWNLERAQIRCVDALGKERERLARRAR